MLKRRLLLADDSITIQKVVNLTFADEGIEVVTAGDGDAAMKRFVEATPDLVMADVNMPGVDGYKICEMIKQDDETKDIPVILLVGSFEPFDEEEARRVGADDYLTKPFQSIRQLVNKVSALLNAPGAGGDDDAPIENEVREVETAFSAANDDRKVVEFFDEHLGDAGTDDEMIQTSRIGEFSAETNYSNSYSDTETEDNWLRTRHSTAEDEDEISGETKEFNLEQLNENIHSSAEPPNYFSENVVEKKVFVEEEVFEETVRQYVSEPDQTEQDFFAAEETAESNFDQPSPDPILDFNALNLLEIPAAETPSVRDFEIVNKQSNSETINEKSENEEEITINTEQIVNFPAELIDAFADKLAEKISVRAVKKITAEITPQLVEIFKRLAQEKHEQ